MPARTPTAARRSLSARHPWPRAAIATACVAAGLAAWPLATRAQAPAPAEPSLESLLRTELPQGSAEVGVSTASRLSQSADLAPAVVHVVTRQDIQRQGLRTLCDVLRRLPGLHARDEGEFVRVTVRGIGPGGFNGRVLFLLDGQRLNENIYDAGQIDLDFPVDMSLVERVEFSPGPGSALYGGNALLGVVNVVTQRGDRLAGPQLHWAGSPRGRQEGRVSHGLRDEAGGEWLAAYSFVRWPSLDPLLNLQQDQALAARPYEWDDARRGLLSYRGHGLGLRALSVDRVRGLATEVDGLAGFAQVRDQTHSRALQGSWDGRLAGWDASALLNLQQLRYRLDTPYAEQGQLLGDDRFEALGRWAVVELRAGRPWGQDRHYLLAGLEWQRDALQRFRFDDVGLERVEQRHDGRRLGLFLQDEWRLSERQRLVLGLRRDAVHGDAVRWSPRLAWTWSPEAGSSLKLLAGRAFRSANRFERETNRLFDALPPRAEAVDALELAGERSLGPVWKLRASAYLMRVQRPIDGDAEGRFVNAAAQRLRGLDLGVDARWATGWQLQLSTTVLHLRDAAGVRPNFTPSLQAKWLLSAPVFSEAWRLSLHGFAQSRRRGDGGAVQDLPGFAVSHLQLRWSPTASLDLFVGVQNLGGRRWVEPISPAFSDLTLQRQGESWQGGLQWRP